MKVLINGAEVSEFKKRFPLTPLPIAVDMIAEVKKNDPLLKWLIENLLTDSQLDVVPPNSDYSFRELLR